MDRDPDPLRAYADALRAGDRRLASLIAGGIFRRDREPLAPGGPAPSPVALQTFRRLRDHLGI